MTKKISQRRRSMSIEDNYRRLKEIAYHEGINFFGVADISKIEFPLTSTYDLHWAISLGYRLSDVIIEEITTEPTRRYLYHYRQVNQLLDQVALKICSVIHQAGFKSLPIPASVITDWAQIRADLSHKIVAYHAGLGWIGRSNLIVNSVCGARLRLVSVLTNMPLKPDNPQAFGCGVCYSCVNSCPAGAITSEPHLFNQEKCLQQLKLFAKRLSFGTQYICGICLKACSSKIRL